ncbi:MAG TPA: beta-glucosidase, partial [Terriglobales bacterium]|nr:beta-glucosidase [Terriglobales bacterium]
MGGQSCSRAALVLLLLAGSWQLLAQAAPLSDPAVEARVTALMSQMTLEEKIGQLNQFSAGQPTGPGTGRTDYGEMVARGQIGSLF